MDKDTSKNEDVRVVREYEKERVVIDGVTIIRRVIETECKMCKWFPFGVWIGNWVLILGGTVLLAWLFS